MDFNFYEQYKTYSNIDLLKIIKRPNEYQQAAVTIAIQILNERVVTPEEIEQADQYYQGIENDVKAKNEKIDGYKNKATGFFEPVLQPSEKVEPDKWLNILLFFTALQYGWLLFNAAKRLIRFWHVPGHGLDMYFFLDVLDFLYIPVMFFLLYKRKRWGWILLFAGNLMVFLSGLSQSYIFFKYQFIHHGNTSSFLFPIIVSTIFIIFLWQKNITNYFNVTNKVKKITAAIVTTMSIILILIPFVIYR